MKSLIVLWALAVSTADAADTQNGEAVYQANCMACHGAAADGKGPAAAALNPPPTNFTDPAYWAGKTDEQVKQAIKVGKPGTSMIGFSRISDEDLADLVAFMRTKVAEPEPSPE